MPFPPSGGRRGLRAEPAPTVDPQDADAAAALAQRLLAITDRSRADLERRLGQRGYAPETAAEAVGRLQARGWVDDGRFAEELARRRLAHGYGRRRVLADLAARGVDAETVARTDQGIATGQAEAVRLAAGRLRRGHDGPPEPPEVRRLAAALERRGFEMADIRAVLRELATGVTPPPDDAG
ncbi:MAG: regulatory protein RecX [Candidatus Dormibacteria bacterium]